MFRLNGQSMNARTQFIRFVIVGGLATALHYALLFVLVHAGLFAPVAASSIGFATSAVLNYLLNRRMTFQSDRPHAEAGPRFVLVAVSGLCLNAALLWLINVVGGVHYLAAQVPATLATLFWNFGLNRLWTFPSSAAKASMAKEP